MSSDDYDDYEGHEGEACFACGDIDENLDNGLCEMCAETARDEEQDDA
mgnify:CR=1 FL=1|tara:strand:+ start:225 stop:368 length:144 start_codon:yes stop_codon:yes gene_type:complete